MKFTDIRRRTRTKQNAIKQAIILFQLDSPKVYLYICSISPIDVSIQSSMPFSYQTSTPFLWQTKGLADS